MPLLTILVVAGSWVLLLILTVLRVSTWNDGSEE